VTERSKNENKKGLSGEEEECLERVDGKVRNLRARKGCFQTDQKMRGIILWRGRKLSWQDQRCVKNSLRWRGIGLFMRRGTERQQKPRNQGR